MRVRIIASKPRNEDEAEISSMIGKDFPVVKKDDEGVWVKAPQDPTGYFIYHDEYEVVEQKEPQESATL